MTDAKINTLQTSAWASDPCAKPVEKKKTANDRLFLFAGRLYRQTGQVTRLVKFIVRSHLKKQISNEWYRFIDEQPALALAPDNVKAVLADKIHRPFARCHLSTEARVAILINHYRLMASLFPTPFLADMTAGSRFPLVHMTGKNEDERFVVTISRDMLSQHQGELTFLLIDEVTSVPLARLVANVGTDETGNRFFIIAGLQGPGTLYKKDIVRVTRHMDGLRPKRAILEVACAMAQWMQTDTVIATAKKNHVSQTKRKWQRRVVADYDGFWHEFAPTVLSSGDYQLPVPLPKRNQEDVVPKKRREWQRRCERLEAIGQEVEKSLKAYAI